MGHPIGRRRDDTDDAACTVPSARWPENADLAESKEQAHIPQEVPSYIRGGVERRAASVGGLRIAVSSVSWCG
jgi:hypothetical protein